MEKIIKLMDKESLVGLKRFAFVWFELGEETDNMNKALTLNKEELIDFLLEDFAWSELPEKHFLGLYEQSKKEWVYVYSEGKEVNLTELFIAYLKGGN